MGDSIAREMSEERVPDLNVATELALCEKTLEEVVADMSQSSFSAEERQQVVDKKMKELGMSRLVFNWFALAESEVRRRFYWMRDDLKQILEEVNQEFSAITSY